MGNILSTLPSKRCPQAAPGVGGSARVWQSTGKFTKITPPLGWCWLLGFVLPTTQVRVCTLPESSCWSFEADRQTLAGPLEAPRRKRGT